LVESFTGSCATRARSPARRSWIGDWLPTVAAENWLIITRDRRIQDHTAEIAAVKAHKARLITLSSVEATTKFAQLEIVMCRWRDIERRAELPGPFICRATRSQLSPLDIGD
jgi:homogentisate 1,2-dioxygenase